MPARARAHPPPLDDAAVLALLVDHAHDPLAFLDPEFRFVRVNRAYARACRRPAEDLHGRGVFELYPSPEDEALFERARDTGEPVVARERPLDFPGEPERGTTWWDWTLTPARGARGVLRGFVLSLRDVTEKVAARWRVEESEAVARAWAAELDAVMESVPAAVQIAHDPEARHITGSRSAYELMRMPYGSNVSKSSEVPPTHFRVLGPDGRELASHELPMQRAAATAMPVRNAQITLAYDDGSECQLLGNATPLFDADGNVRGAVGAFLDVTERVRAEAALRESEETYRTLAEAAPDLVWMADPALRPVFVNSRWTEFFGKTIAEVAADGWEPLVHPDDLPALRARLEAAVRTGSAFEAEVRYRRRDGAWRWFLGRAVPLRGARREVVRWIGAATEIHDRRRAEEALREADRRKDEFLAILSHELRNPLAPILNGVAILNRIGSEGPQAHRARAVIERQARHMAHLVDDLLDITRISRGKLQLRFGAVELAGLVRRAVEDHRALLDGRGLEVALDVRDEPLWLTGDATRLAQVIGNLLQNAAKFTDPGGHVSISVERRGGEAVVRVRDDGVGIAPELLPQLFQAFSQGERTLERTRGGLGLGLALARALVTLHGGRIDAASDGVGKGAEVILALPLGAAQAPERDPDAAPRRTAERRTVLVVEDNVDSATTLAEVLELAGHEVLVANDGAEGLALARRARPDVVVCDLGLPSVNGFEVAQAVRGAGGDRPVLVALTGYATSDDAARALSAGFDHHLSKPPRLERLLSLIAAAPPRG